MGKGKGAITIKTFAQLSEKEAYELLAMSAGRGTSPSEPIRQKILDLISKGQRYGIVMAETAEKEKLDAAECKKIVIAINLSFKKTATPYGIRYVPAKDGFLFVPAEKIAEMFGKS